MTAVPVVSTQLNTRTVRECYFDAPGSGGGWHTFGDHSCKHSASRERLTVDPVFVVLPEAPDLTCRDCHGTGESIEVAAEGTFEGRHWTSYKLCPSCNGTGVSPVYAATWQWRYIASTKPTAWQDGLGVDTKSVQRRQVVEWRARRVEPLPVVGVNDEIKRPCVFVSRSGTPTMYPDGVGYWHPDEPWAVDLRPGQCVLRLDGLEHLQQPHTVEQCQCSDDLDCGTTYPLSVPDGVLSWIELA